MWNRTLAPWLLEIWQSLSASCVYIVQVFKFLGDLTKDNNSKEIVDQTLAHFGELDVLVC